MKKFYTSKMSLACAATALTTLSLSSQAAPWVKNKDGVYGYEDTPKLPWCEYRVHDSSRPQPPRVDPGSAGPPMSPPSDAIVLFDGKDLSKWKPCEWTIKDGAMVAGKGNIATKEGSGRWRRVNEP